GWGSRSATSATSFTPAAPRPRTPTGRTPTHATARRWCGSRWSSQSRTRRAMPNKIAAFAPLLLAVGGSLVYHLAAKSIPKSVDPSAALIGLYATALAGSVLTYAVLKPGPVALQFGSYWHPTIAAVGLGALLVELGLLLAYRRAWPVSTPSVIANARV